MNAIAIVMVVKMLPKILTASSINDKNKLRRKVESNKKPKFSIEKYTKKNENT